MGETAFRSPKVETTHKSEQNSKLFTKKREDPHFCESSLCRDAKASLCVIFLFIRRYVFSGLQRYDEKQMCTIPKNRCFHEQKGTIA